MSGPNGEGLYLPPLGYRRRGLVTAAVLPPEPVRTGHWVSLERWESGRFDLVVRPDRVDGRAVDVAVGQADSVDDMPRAAAALLLAMGWMLAVPWEPWCGQALRAPVRRVTGAAGAPDGRPGPPRGGGGRGSQQG